MPSHVQMDHHQFMLWIAIVVGVKHGLVVMRCGTVCGPGKRLPGQALQRSIRSACQYSWSRSLAVALRR